MLHEIRHPAMNGIGSDEVVVIQHESEVLCIMAHEVIGQHGQHGLLWRGLRRVQQLERRYPHLCIKVLQRSNQVGEKVGRIVVFRFQREPGDRYARLSEPLGEQHRFAKPGRG